ncbi:MAG: DUF3850 domain-containing protein [Pseudomonadota bacterium]
MKILIDIERPVEELNKLIAHKDSLEALESIPGHIHDSLFRLLHSLLLNICISSTGTTTSTGDHVIRLGVARDFKIMTGVRYRNIRKRRSMKTHRLKIDQDYLDNLIHGRKKVEIRINDRDYQRGDLLLFRDYSKLEPRKYWFLITHVHSGLGMERNYVALSVNRTDPPA